ncbi:transcriptional regulator [Glaesserella parasuis]|uniref:YheO domain-containing protein involved in signaling based on the presence of this PAS domain n=1 Tax=Glaesserella parasuis serovar 5 (strain SH0165) TaxID=557723 RepID=B8F700_GLAP5|nr:transcriptional regulator [Glaesserella parasuis]ACL33102.1 YheO domain-containing protein involved in signaling based on the presence of this PAS domain [Glaesserella parasuis SH0165]EMY46413.1 YheO domain-containing protein [Glaesserella parasuis gx033]MDG6236835.1 transcriptional regulator [Glaesserella parasuis]MDG6239166.1 transcriptional regulator [Glaesserella parasuis]MDG6247850.1 transcriptional regulator [Glaesserella parasuis]
MTAKFNPLSDEDHAILASYFPVVDGIAALIGEHCEIVLHSLEFLEHSAIYIVNGHNTDRKIGSPITDRALWSLHHMQTDSVSKPYFTRAKGGVLMKSVTIAIRNGKQHVIGLICININLDVPVSQFLNSFIALPESEGSVNFASSVEDLVAQTIESTIVEIKNDRNISNSNKNRHIVTALFEKGIFDIKDAINQVADRLEISRHTVYLYIRQLKQDGE